MGTAVDLELGGSPSLALMVALTSPAKALGLPVYRIRTMLVASFKAGKLGISAWLCTGMRRAEGTAPNPAEVESWFFGFFKKFAHAGDEKRQKIKPHQFQRPRINSVDVCYTLSPTITPDLFRTAG